MRDLLQNLNLLVDWLILLGSGCIPPFFFSTMRKYLYNITATIAKLVAVRWSQST
eukprot:m.439112 g.439112  ORF g.439112 m.439112 type:complete len:55 (+) comp21447_c0_seq3:1207-1371(+)